MKKSAVVSSGKDISFLLLLHCCSYIIIPYYWSILSPTSAPSAYDRTDLFWWFSSASLLRSERWSCLFIWEFLWKWMIIVSPLCIRFTLRKAFVDRGGDAIWSTIPNLEMTHQRQTNRNNIFNMLHDANIKVSWK